MSEMKEMKDVRIQRALISVSNKAGLVEFANGLKKHNVEILSSGGTARALREGGVAAKEVSEVTGFPEMMDGRVKTLHPVIHAGILAVRSNPEHMDALREQGIEPIELVVVNLYPFQETILREGVTEEEAIEQIDIGGPSLVRAAAKNFGNVTVVIDPNDYAVVLKEMEDNAGATTLELRRKLAAKAFAHTAAYDASVQNWFFQQLEETFPESLTLSWHKRIPLRYGENPHQLAAFYVEPTLTFPCIANARQLHGKELSFNNIADLDAALELVRDFDEPAAAIIKHTNPCGCAVGSTLAEAFAKARDADPEARFGGIIAVNRPVDIDTAREILVPGSFYEALIAPGYEEEALEEVKRRKGWGETIRVLSLEAPMRNLTEIVRGVKHPLRSVKSVTGGLLVQTRDMETVDAEKLQVVTERAPTQTEMRDLLFAWKVVKHVKSNAVLLAKDGVTVGVGAGQMNRAVSTKLAVEHAGDRAKGASLASEAFFPMPDAPEIAAKAGVTAIIQPGGSKGDASVIAVANKYGIAMVFTGIRHFRH